MWTGISNRFKKIVSTILDIDDTEIPQEQYSFLWDVSRTMEIAEEFPEDLKHLLQNLSKKHFIEEITIAKNNGSLVVSSNGSGHKEALTGSALYNYINSEIPTKTVLIKSDKWKMLVPFNGKIYVMTASSDLTDVEMSCIIREIEEFLQTNSVAKIAKQETLLNS
ncbi:MAG: hypothetical protein Q7K42_06455 [Candidatus Diapherotrites archaeon]|nr:hypothetical protein [Candidatus Diapherotrites archaeon]